MKATRLLTRVAPAAGAAALLLTMGGGGTPAGATDATGSTGVSMTVTNGPVYLQGDGGFSCSDPGNANRAASLSGDVSVTFVSPATDPADAGDTVFHAVATIGSGNGYVQLPFSGVGDTVTIPAGSPGLKCDSLEGQNTLPVSVTVYSGPDDSNSYAHANGVVLELDLTAID